MDLPSSRQALGNVARAHLDLPSPASEDISLVTPGLGQPCSSIDSVFALQQWRTADALPEVATLTAAEPGTVQLPQVLTPAQESAPVLSLDAVVGAAVNPVPSSNLPLRPITLRAAHGLRLPSFESLGIANRRPEILRDTTQYNASIAEDDSEDVSSGADAVDTLAGHDRQVSQSIFLPTSTSQAPTRKSLHPFLGPLTPPEDQVSLQWDSVAKDSDLGSESANTGSLPPQRPGAQASNAHGGSSSAPAIRLERSASDRAKGYWLDQTAGIMSMFICAWGIEVLQPGLTNSFQQCRTCNLPRTSTAPYEYFHTLCPVLRPADTLHLISLARSTHKLRPAQHAGSMSFTLYLDDSTCLICRHRLQTLLVPLSEATITLHPKSLTARYRYSTIKTTLRRSPAHPDPWCLLRPSTCP